MYFTHVDRLPDRGDSSIGLTRRTDTRTFEFLQEFLNSGEDIVQCHAIERYKDFPGSVRNCVNKYKLPINVKIRNGRYYLVRK